MFELKNICFKNISFKLTNQFVYILIYVCFLINLTNGAPKSSCSAVNTVFTTRGFTLSDIVVDPVHGKCFIDFFPFILYFAVFFFILNGKSSLYLQVLHKLCEEIYTKIIKIQWCIQGGTTQSIHS